MSYVWEIGIAKGERWVCRGKVNLEVELFVDMLMKLQDVER